MTMQLIETKTLGAAAASIEFTSIPQDGTDLMFLCSLRNTNDIDYIGISINSSTSSFTQRGLSGTGSSIVNNNRTDNLFIGMTVNSSLTANTFTNSSVYVPNYTSSTNKSLSLDSVQENNATSSQLWITAALRSNTDAITAFGFIAEAGGNFAIGSTISLYKVTKGTDGIVTTS